MELIQIKESLYHLAKATVEQAIEDFISLREIGCIDVDQVKSSMWRYHNGLNWRFKPLGYRTPSSVKELVDFLKSNQFKILAEHTGYPVKLTRERLGLIPSDKEVMTATKDLPWISTPSKSRRGHGNDGSHLPELPLHTSWMFSKRPTFVKKEKPQVLVKRDAVIREVTVTHTSPDPKAWVQIHVVANLFPEANTTQTPTHHE